MFFVFPKLMLHKSLKLEQNQNSHFLTVTSTIIKVKHQLKFRMFISAVGDTGVGDDGEGRQRWEKSIVLP